MSNIYIKLRKGLTFVSCLLPLGVALTACSDWDDHYNSLTVSPTANETLWENISSNSELSDFAAVLKEQGYDRILNGSETYTVWAPLNGTFDISAYSGSSANITTRFLQNHIAHNAYGASGEINERVYVLNSKSQTFTGNGSYTINGVNIQQANIAGKNGILHTLNGYIPFKQNIYESLNADEFAIDSIAAFFHRYDVRELDKDKSTAGPVINGEQTYIDSVMVESNVLIPDAANPYRGYNAAINTEDSNYTMILPTNKAWISAKTTIGRFYNFIPSYNYRNSVIEANVPTTTRPTVINDELEQLNIEDVNAFTDSIANLNLMLNLTFNNNSEYNRRLNYLNSGETLTSDSIVSVLGIKSYTEDAAALFTGAQRVEKSNGSIWVTDDLHMNPWQAWNPRITIEAEYTRNQKGTYNATASTENVSAANRNPAVSGTVSNNAYCLVTPASSTSNPNVSFSLGSVRSATYNIYVVVVPGNITNANTTPLPNIFRASVGYNDSDGSLKEMRLVRSIESDASKIDTLLLGEFTFPVCYAYVANAYPYLRIQSTVTTSTQASHDRTLRIDKIILVPTEMDEYIKAHPDYKYEKD